MKKIILASAIALSVGLLSAHASVPASGPNGENPSGLFATYFSNMVSTPCTGTGILVGFNSTSGADYLKGTCASIGSKLATFLGSYGVAPTGEAVIGFDAITGAPTFGSVAGAGGGSAAGAWLLAGNTGTVAGTDSIGTNDAQDFVLKSNNAEVLRLKADGTIAGLRSSNNTYGPTNSLLLGFDAGGYMAGSNNVAMGGYRAGMFMAGNYNVAMGGIQAGGMIGSQNVAIGGYWPANSMNGNNNTAIGGTHVGSSMGGVGSVALGGSVNGHSSTGSHNVTIGGHQAGYGMNATLSVMIGGVNAGRDSRGEYNMVLGGTEGGVRMLGRNNVVLGGYFNGADLGGVQNVSLGGNSAGYTMTGTFNTAIGGQYVGNAMAGMLNTAIGGYNASITNNSVRHSVVIGSGAVSNQSGAVIITGNGANVGIGTSNPSEKLDVNGNVKAVAFLYSSDKRLKTNIAALTNVDSKLGALNGVSFNWKNTGTADIGFIAQDVEKILPELVHTGNDGMKSLQYGNLTALLVEGYKYQKDRADNLEKRIEALEKLIN